MRTSIGIIGLQLVTIFLVGCSKYQNAINYSPNDSMRVAVLPFIQVDSKGNPVTVDSSLLIDDVSVLSSQLKVSPASYVQQIVESTLGKTGLDIVSPAFVSAQLSHNGFTHGDGATEVDIKKVLDNDRKALCELLACDALLYGKVRRWERSYYAIQSVSSIELELTLINATNDQVLFKLNGSDADSRGLTKGPTGFSDLVLEPIRGLDNSILTDLAHKMIEKMLLPLYIENRPEYLNSAPPAIFASAHDGKIGSEGTSLLSPTDPLTVLIRGSTGNSAFFSIGDKIEYLPMLEQDNGHYIGRYYPLPSDDFRNQSIFVYLIDQFGKTTKQRIGTSTVTLAHK